MNGPQPYRCPECHSPIPGLTGHGYCPACHFPLAGKYLAIKDGEWLATPADREQMGEILVRSDVVLIYQLEWTPDEMDGLRRPERSARPYRGNVRVYPAPSKKDDRAQQA